MPNTKISNMPVAALPLSGEELIPGVQDGLNVAIPTGALSGGSGLDWDDITGKPATFAPSAHVHAVSDVTGLQTALDGKQPIATVLTNTTAAFTTAQESKLAGVAGGATANSADATLLARANHAGTQAAATITGLASVATSGAYSDLTGAPALFDGAYGSLSGTPSTFAPSAHSHVISDVTGLQSELDGKQPLATVLTNTTAAFTTAQETKLSGIATGATVNAADSALRDRSTHTGTQAAATITGLAAVATSGAYGSLSGVPSTFAPSAHSHAISDVTGLQAALDGKAAGAIEAEIIEARGDRSALDLRISTISNFASPNAGGVIVGQHYDNSFQGTNGTTLAGAANRIELAPYYTSTRLRIDRIGVAVSTGVASALGRVVIYGSDSDGWPDALLYEGDSDLDFGSTGYKSHTLDFTFDSGRQYWLGVRFSATGTIRAVNVSSAVNLGLSSATASNYTTLLRRTVTFANPAPDPWVFTNSDRISNVGPPSIRFRAAALP